MYDRKIVVTINLPIQKDSENFKQYSISRVFTIKRSFKDVLSWAEAEGIQNPQIYDLHFSEYTGESS
jgi:hypothetical protein